MHEKRIVVVISLQSFYIFSPQVITLRDEYES